MTQDDKPGLAMRIARHMMSQEGAAAAWGLELEGADEGYARVAMRLKPEMLNGFRMAHGGMIFALADAAFAYACNSRNQMTVAQGGSISFIDAGREGERLVAEAREISTKGRSGVYGIAVKGEDGRVIAHMQGLSRRIGDKVIDEEDDNG